MLSVGAGSLTSHTVFQYMESRSCLNTGDGQLSVLAPGEGALISYL